MKRILKRAAKKPIFMLMTCLVVFRIFDGVIAEVDAEGLIQKPTECDDN